MPGTPDGASSSGSGLVPPSRAASVGTPSPAHPLALMGPRHSALSLRLSSAVQSPLKAGARLLLASAGSHRGPEPQRMAFSTLRLQNRVSTFSSALRCLPGPLKHLQAGSSALLCLCSTKEILANPAAIRQGSVSAKRQERGKGELPWFKSSQLLTPKRFTFPDRILIALGAESPA